MNDCYVIGKFDSKYFIVHQTNSGRKVLESRHLADDERIDQLEEQLKTAKFMAEDADRKYDEVGRLVGMHNLDYFLISYIIILHLYRYDEARGA